MRRRSGSIKRQIDLMVRRIVRRFHPEKVILFGSHARGTAGPDSDVDLLVVMPVNGEKRHKAVEIGVALGGLPFPLDIVVTTPEEYAWRKEVAGTIERPAFLEGRVLYAHT
jgi:predicted nucleotidyltransferase